MKETPVPSTSFKNVDGEEFFAPEIRLVKTEKSKNGYYVWINGVAMLTSGPIEIDREGHYWPRVTLTLVAGELVEE